MTLAAIKPETHLVQIGRKVLCADFLPCPYNSASREQRAAALKFVVHFIGDIHQPMHAAKEAEGGNGVHVRFLSSDRCGPYDCNLHGVWDTSMILHAGLKPDDYAERLEELIKSEHLAGQDGGTPEQWANESVQTGEGGLGSGRSESG